MDQVPSEDVPNPFYKHSTPWLNEFDPFFHCCPISIVYIPKFLSFFSFSVCDCCKLKIKLFHRLMMLTCINIFQYISIFVSPFDVAMCFSFSVILFTQKNGQIIKCTACLFDELLFVGSCKPIIAESS